MKIFDAPQVKEIDAYTIQNEPINSFDLMERAARAFFNQMLLFLKKEHRIYVFAGPGNNGGDALVIARYLLMSGLSVQAYLVNPEDRLSPDCEKAKKKLIDAYPDSLKEVNKAEKIAISLVDYVVDGLFGSGLSRPLDGIFSKVVSLINDSGATVFSIDIPSGLRGEDNKDNDKNEIIRADYTFSFQFPPLTFFLSESEKYVGKYYILDIGLHPQALHDFPSDYYLIEEKKIKKILKTRSRFSHKGTFGHALLVAGSYGKMGAAVLAAKACLRTGCGLLSVHIPQRGYDIMQTSVPEAMVEQEVNDTALSGSDLMLHEQYDAIGIGPGIDTDEKTKYAFLQLLKRCRIPLVIDADALNLIAKSTEILHKLPAESILTPHPKEFDRLAGYSASGYDRLQKQIAFSRKHNVIVVLKGANTSIAFPDGRCFFNPTGNPGMATAGSGDVLTGVITSLLAQKYTPEEAALLGVYLHGLAGDFAAQKLSQESMLSGDIIEFLGAAFLNLRRI